MMNEWPVAAAVVAVSAPMLLLLPPPLLQQLECDRSAICALMYTRHQPFYFPIDDDGAESGRGSGRGEGRCCKQPNKHRAATHIIEMLLLSCVGNGRCIDPISPLLQRSMIR